MFVVVFALSLLASEAAGSLSICQKGDANSGPLSVVNKFVIPAGQQTGRVSFPDQYKCWLNSKPIVLRVEVIDGDLFDSSASIQMKNDLSEVDIYRAGPSYSSQAEVKVSVVCWYVNDRKPHRDYSTNNVLGPVRK